MTPRRYGASHVIVRKMSTGGIQLSYRACSAPVPRPADRRNHASASSEHVALELRQLVGRFLPASAIYASNDSYTCRPYFSRIEKILKLRKTTEDIEQEVMVNLKHAAYLYEVPHRREEEECSRGVELDGMRKSESCTSMTEGHDASESVSSERRGEPACFSLLSDIKRIR